MSRLHATFADLSRQHRAGFIPFVMAGDPTPAAALQLVRGLIDAGADIVEIGMPFTDPMADGPAIQAAGLRALKAGMTLAGTLDLVRAVRLTHPATPIVLMGYFNPIHSYGVDRFVAESVAAGVDGLIIVDVPPEEDAALAAPARAAGLDIVRLATPTTNAARLPRVVEGASGFVYYVSVAGVTGAGSGAADDIRAALARLRAATDLPIAVGFGIKTEERAREIAKTADAVVVGSALVETLAAGLATDTNTAINQTLSLAARLSRAIKTARDPR